VMEVGDDADKNVAATVSKNQKSADTMMALFVGIDDLKNGMIVQTELAEHSCCCVVLLVEMPFEGCYYQHSIERQWNYR